MFHYGVRRLRVVLLERGAEAIPRNLAFVTVFLRSWISVSCSGAQEDTSRCPFSSTSEKDVFSEIDRQLSRGNSVVMDFELPVETQVAYFDEVATFVAATRAVG